MPLFCLPRSASSRRSCRRIKKGDQHSQRPFQGSSPFEPILFVDGDSAQLLFKFLELNLPKLFRLDDFEPFESLLKKFVAHRRTARLLQSNNVFCRALSSYDSVALCRLQELCLWKDELRRKDFGTNLDCFVCVVIPTFDLALRDGGAITIVML